MGFFNFLKHLKEGNFGLIASNVASIYLILKSKYISRFPENHILVGTAGIIDVLKYIEANQLVPAQIMAMARSVNDINKHSDNSDVIYDISFFVRRLETEMFAVDTKLDYFHIREIVSQKFPVIRSSVEEVINKYDNEKKLNSYLEAQTNYFMSDSKFSGLRVSVGIIEN